MSSEMSEHICEENIEENYESFDVIENDIMKARPQPAATNHRFVEQNFPPRDERSLIEKFQAKFFNHEIKVALNCDVDLIKTTKIPYMKQEVTEDDKILDKFSWQTNKTKESLTVLLKLKFKKVVKNFSFKF